MRSLTKDLQHNIYILNMAPTVKCFTCASVITALLKADNQGVFFCKKLKIKKLHNFSSNKSSCKETQVIFVGYTPLVYQKLLYCLIP